MPDKKTKSIKKIVSKKSKKSQDLDDLTSELGEVVLAYAAEQSKSHSGPLPQSEDFEQYERTFPGAAQKILAYAEKEQKHRHFMDKKMADAAITDTNRGQDYALIIMGLLIASALYCAYLQMEIASGLFLTPVALGVAKKFIDGRHEKK